MADSDKDDFKDDLDKTNIDQMHKAVLQISSNCFEIKKLCATVLVSVATLLATFTNKQLDTSFFVAGGIIIMFFWLLDSQSYYYQEKLRAYMKRIAEKMTERHSSKAVVDGVGLPLTEERENRKVEIRAIRSLFNESMFFYLFLVIVILILWMAFKMGLINAFPAKGNL